MLIKTLPGLLDKESKLEKPISKQCISKETHQAVNVHNNSNNNRATLINKASSPLYF